MTGTELADKSLFVTNLTSKVPSQTAQIPRSITLMPPSSSDEFASAIKPIPPTLPLQIHKIQAKADEVHRSIYIGNLASCLPENDVIKFFSICGPVTYLRLAGDPTHPSRFAFLEFGIIIRNRLFIDIFD